MCVTLKGKGTELAGRCTSGNHGEPFLATNRDYIVVPFDSINDVKSIKISFSSGKYGQISSLSVGGTSNQGLEIFFAKSWYTVHRLISFQKSCFENRWINCGSWGP